MHASHIKKKKLNLTLNSSLKISKSAFYNKENFSEKKKIRSIFNENTDQFCIQNKIKSENTDQL